MPRATWLGLYLVALAGPFLLVASFPREPGRTFTHELGSGLGIAVLAILAMQLVLPARLRIFAPLGADVAVRLHRRLATVVLALIAAHVVVIVLADPARLALFRFVDAPVRAQAAILAVVSLGLLFASSFARRRIRLSYAGWRGLHLVLGAAALVLALVHTVGVGRYLSAGSGIVALAAITVVPIASLAILRMARLRKATVRPYVVKRVVAEGGGVNSLQLVAVGHSGQSFRPGQFAWIRLADQRTSLAEHPFSYASTARRPDQPAFAIRAQNGFTARVAELAVGTPMLVDGPHGTFRPDPVSAGMLLVAGGIGITPTMSILHTAWDDHSHARYVVLYSGRTLESLAFLEQLELMRLRLDLTVVTVLSEPPNGWIGERGRIRLDLIDRHLPADVRRWQFAVCGPPALVDTTCRALTQLGIPPERVHAERFVAV
jgi:3-phenylpropionate/trans-cinnamate dioxygenase ferredoxin reductase subunit